MTAHNPTRSDHTTQHFFEGIHNMPEQTATVVEAFRSGLTLYTTRAIKRLSTGVHNEQITRAEMAAIVGRPCEPGEKGYGNVLSAIRRVEREHGITWKWGKTEQAWICLNDSRKVGETKHRMGRARRMAKAAVRVGISVDVAKLSDGERKELSVQLSVAGLIGQAGSASTIRKLEAMPTVPNIADGFMKMIGST